MASITIHSGLSSATNHTLNDPNTQVLIVGQHRWMKALRFDQQLTAKLGGKVDEKLFSQAVQLRDASGGKVQVPLFLNRAKVNNSDDYFTKRMDIAANLSFR